MVAQPAGDPAGGPTGQDRRRVDPGVERGGALAFRCPERLEPVAQSGARRVGVEAQRAVRLRSGVAGDLARLRKDYDVVIEAKLPGATKP